MANKDLEQLIQYRTLLSEYEDINEKIAELKHSKKYHTYQIDYFDGAYEWEFRKQDEIQLKGPNSKGLMAINVLTGGLATGFLVDRVRKEKKAEKWNSGWHERYQEKYKKERDACKKKDEEYITQITQEISDMEDKRLEWRNKLEDKEKEFALPQTFRSVKKLNDLIEIFNSDETQTLKEVIAIYFANERVKDEIAERGRRKRFEEEILEKQKEQMELLDEIRAQNDSLRYENEQLKWSCVKF